jgi:recombination protein RecA
MADKEETPTLNKVIAQINKDAGEVVVGRLADMENINTERIPCGIKALDDAVGGGFPLGRMVEFFGLESSGKSLIAQLIMANAQKKGGECVYVDAEGSFDPTFAKMLGVDTDKVAIVQTGIGEDIVDTIAKLLEAEPMVIVIDSIGAMITREEVEQSVEKIFMAPKARLMSKGLPKLTTLNKKTLIIFINQLRKVITSWGGGGFTTPGGMALGFYSSIRLEVKRDKEFIYADNKKSGEIIGQIVHFNVKKNKTAIPYKTGSFKYYFDGHIE